MVTPRGLVRIAAAMALCLSWKISALSLTCIVHPDLLRRKINAVFPALVSQIGVALAERQWLCAINTRGG